MDSLQFCTNIFVFLFVYKARLAVLFRFYMGFLLHWYENAIQIWRKEKDSSRYSKNMVVRKMKEKLNLWLSIKVFFRVEENGQKCRRNLDFLEGLTDLGKPYSVIRLQVQASYIIKKCQYLIRSLLSNYNLFTNWFCYSMFLQPLSKKAIKHYIFISAAYVIWPIMLDTVQHPFAEHTFVIDTCILWTYDFVQTHFLYTFGVIFSMFLFMQKASLFTGSGFFDLFACTQAVQSNFFCLGNQKIS